MPSLGLGLGFCQNSSTWTPHNLANQFLWLRGDSIVGTSSVTGWTDKSGAGNSFTASANNPSLNTSAVNGQPGLALNGSQGLLGSTTFLPSGATSIAIVFKLSTVPTGNFQSLLCLENSSSQFSEVAIVAIGGYSNYSATFASGSPGVGFTQTPDTNPHALIWTWDGSSTYQAYLDNVSQTIGTSGAFVYSGESVSAGGRSVAGVISAGTIGVELEVIGSSSIWSSSDRANLHQYFNARYGAGVG